MLILAFDTTSDVGGVGIFRDAECLALVANEGPANRYSVTLFEMVDQALGQARLELREIELFAAANGPGSFTGIRVGLAAARAWGKAFDRTVRGVSVLEALVNKACPGPDWLFTLLDARRGEFFLGSFRKTTPQAGAAPDVAPDFRPARAALKGGATPSESAAATGVAYEPADTGWVLKPDALRMFLEEREANSESAACLVRTHDQAAGDLRTSLPASLGWQQIPGPLMDSIAAIARREELSNRPSSDANLDAYYIRRPDAEINWKE